MKHFRVWVQLTKNAFSSFLSNRLDSGSYFAGKCIRFVFFLILIVSLFEHTGTLAGYSQKETLLFFLTFNVVDVLAQAFLRGTYFFKGEIRRGTFDGVLTKPVNSLFYSLTRMTDLLDFLFFVPILIFLILVIYTLPGVNFLGVVQYIFLLMVGLGIIISIHIISAAVTLMTDENDNLLWLYRETVGLGRFPPEILSSKLQFFFTYIFPIIVVVAFPVKVLLGQLDFIYFALAILLACLFLVGSLLLWKHSLKFYSSASS